MSRQRLPLIGTAGSKTTAKPPLSSPALHQAKHRKRNRRQTSSSSSSSHPHPGPPSILLSDTTMTPWGGLALSEPSFTSIPPRPPAPPPPPPPAPQPTPSTPYRGRQNAELEEVSSSSFNSEVPSPPAAVHQDSADGGVRELRMKGGRVKVLPQHRVPHPPRLPPLRPVTNLSFSRSFTFSFFELPLHQTPRCRAERIKNLMLLLRQLHY